MILALSCLIELIFTELGHFKDLYLKCYKLFRVYFYATLFMLFFYQTGDIYLHDHKAMAESLAAVFYFICAPFCVTCVFICLVCICSAQFREARPYYRSKEAYLEFCKYKSRVAWLMIFVVGTFFAWCSGIVNTLADYPTLDFDDKFYLVNSIVYSSLFCIYGFMASAMRPSFL